jgi:hypothetical protein
MDIFASLSPRVRNACLHAHSRCLRLAIATLLAIAAGVSSAGAQTWKPVANPPHAATHNVTTLLEDGRVLSVGLGGPPLLFDPRNGSWSPTPGAPADLTRAYPAVVRLKDGRVLVTGGVDSLFNTAFTTGYLFDPATNGWIAAASISTGRYAPAALLLPDGRVLVAGGIAWPSTYLDTAEIYDPASDSWTPTTNAMSVGRVSGCLAQLPDGRILLCGGFDGLGSVMNTDRFDPVTNTFTRVGDMNVGAQTPTAVLLPTGKVLLIGGGVAAELYDPVTATWAPTTPLPTPSQSPSLALLPDGRVLAVVNTLATTAFIYNPADETWAPGPAMLPGNQRIQPSFTLLPDGRVLMAGSMTPTNPFAEILENRIVTTAPAAAGLGHRSQAASALLPDGRVLVAGGASSTPVSEPLATSGVYDPVANTWQPAPPMSTPRFNNPDALLLRDGRVMVLGGSNASVGIVTAATDIFDPATMTWDVGAPMNTARGLGATVVLSNGWVLTFGGTPGTVAILDSSEMYIPEINRWVPIAPMPSPRWRHAAVRLADDRVLVAGGREVGTGTAEAWIYDYRTNNWTPTGSMNVTHDEPQAKLLPDGRVLLISSFANGFPATTSEVWDPVTGSWTAVPIAGDATWGAALVTLPSGELAAVAGESTAHVRVFDPITTTWTVAGSLATARWNPEVVVLPDGRLLVVGGAAGVMSIEDPEIITITRGRDLTRLPALDPVGTLVNSQAPAVTGGGFVPPHGATMSLAGASTPANIPFLQYRSMTTGLRGRLPLDSWTDTSATLDAMSGHPLGPVAVEMIVNGIRGDARLTTIDAADTTIQVDPVNVFARGADQNLTLTAHVGSPVSPIGGGVVLFLVTMGGGVGGGGAIVGQTARSAIVGPDGIASVTYVLPAGTSIGNYSIIAVYTGDARHEPAATTAGVLQVTPIPTTLTLTASPTTVVRGGTVHVTASAVPAEGPVAAGTIAISASADGCTINGPSGECDLVVSQLGAVTIAATFTPATPLYLGSTAQTIVQTTGPNPTPVREYTLAEGVTNSFFATFILIANPNASEAPITLTYAGETGLTGAETRTLAPFSRVTIPTSTAADQVGSAFTTRVTSEAGLALVVERATYFDATLRAGDLSTATEGGGSTTWHFAEGANGFFHTYLTLGNPSASEPAAVTVRYSPEIGAAFEREYTVSPHSRTTIDTASESALATASFAMSVTSTRPIAADRVQYFGIPFTGAHADSGASALSAEWYFAEGATGSAFDTYLLLGNPSSEPAEVTVSFHTDSGETIARPYFVPAGGRRTIGVEGEDTRLANVTFWTEVHADRPIVAERAMYIVHDGAWSDATATTGAIAPGLRWGFAEGAVGMTLGYMPYILIANPSAQPADITVQYLRTAGDPVSRSYTLAAGGRLTLDVRYEEPSLLDTQFAMVVSSTNNTPILAERSQYWTLGSASFIGAMTTMGVPLGIVP